MSDAQAPKYDEKLWFTMSDHCGDRHYVTGNGHAGRGKMRAWCPGKSEAFDVSKGQMEASSPETQYWIKGYLAGSEPAPPEGDARKTWERAMAVFAKTGAWHEGDRSCIVCGTTLLPSTTGEECEGCYGQHL